jgi:hypothetical protein
MDAARIVPLRIAASIKSVVVLSLRSLVPFFSSLIIVVLAASSSAG